MGMRTDNVGLWCDDITFCQEECKRTDCPRNKRNIRDKSVPHSFSVERPADCMKNKKEEDQFEATATIDGEMYTMVGTLERCTDWASHLYSIDGEGKIEISIRRKEVKKR